MITRIKLYSEKLTKIIK